MFNYHRVTFLATQVILHVYVPEQLVRPYIMYRARVYLRHAALVHLQQS